MLRSLREGLDFIEVSVEPIVRLEAIPTDELVGRVLAEEIVLGGGMMLSSGLALIDEDVEEMKEAGLSEAIVFSRPKMVIIVDRHSLNDPRVRRAVEWAIALAQRLGVIPVMEGDMAGTISDQIRNNIGADLMLICPVDKGQTDQAVTVMTERATKDILEIEMAGRTGPFLTVLDYTPCLLLPTNDECLMISCLGLLPEVLSRASRISEPSEIKFPAVLKGMMPGTAWLLSTTLGGIQITDPRSVALLKEADGTAVCLDRDEEVGCRLRVIWF